MANFTISGVWKDANGVITHYAVHILNTSTKTVSKSEKKTKAQAIALVETSGNIVQTVVWNYTKSGWFIGENVHVVPGINGKYLRSNKDNKVTDNLDHLIDYATV